MNAGTITWLIWRRRRLHFSPARGETNDSPGERVSAWTILINVSCMHECMCFYGPYNYSALVRQVSGFSNVVSVRRVHVVLWTAGFKGGGKACLKTRETAALRRGIQ